MSFIACGERSLYNVVSRSCPVICQIRNDPCGLCSASNKFTSEKSQQHTLTNFPLFEYRPNPRGQKTRSTTWTQNTTSTLWVTQQNGTPCVYRILRRLRSITVVGRLSVVDVRQDLFDLTTTLPSPVLRGYTHANV